jgi:hypothetical protein
VTAGPSYLDHFVLDIAVIPAEKMRDLLDNDSARLERPARLLPLRQSSSRYGGYWRAPIGDRDADIEDFIEGFNQPTYRGMRINGQRVATWSSRDGWSGDTRPDAEWIQ